MWSDDRNQWVIIYPFLDGLMDTPNLVAVASASSQQGVIAIPSQPKTSWKGACGRSIGTYVRSLKSTIRSMNV